MRRGKINTDNREWESHYQNILPQLEFEAFRTCDRRHPYIKRVIGFAKDKKRSLEFGSGRGMVSLALKRECPGIQTHLLDFSQGALQYSKKLFSYYGVSGEFCRGSFLDLPYPDGAFDFIHGMTVLEHVKDTQKAVKELTRVLAKGGVGVISVPNSVRRLEHNLYHFINNIQYYSRTFYFREIDNLFISNSCSVLEHFGNNVIFFYPSYPFQYVYRLVQNLFSDRKNIQDTPGIIESGDYENKNQLNSKPSFFRKAMRAWGHGQRKFNDLFDHYEIMPHCLWMTIGVVVRKK